jgi:hypothetical protein
VSNVNGLFQERNNRKWPAEGKSLSLSPFFTQKPKRCDIIQNNMASTFDNVRNETIRSKAHV